MNISFRFRGIITTSGPASCTILWDLSLSCGAVQYRRCPGFTSPAYQSEKLLHHIGCSTFLVLVSSMHQKKPPLSTLGSVFSQRRCSACSWIPPTKNTLDMLHIRIPLSAGLCTAEAASHGCPEVIEFGLSWVDRGDVWEGGRRWMKQRLKERWRGGGYPTQAVPAAHMPAGQVLTWQHVPHSSLILKWEPLHKALWRIVDGGFCASRSKSELKSFRVQFFASCSVCLGSFRLKCGYPKLFISFGAVSIDKGYKSPLKRESRCC